MKKIQLILMSVALIAVVSCKNEGKKVDEEAMDDEVVIEEVVEEVKEISKDLAFVLESKSGSKAFGKVILTENDGEVNLMAEFYGLKPGMHAIHIHEKADCSAEDATSSGGHWNPTLAPHGKWGAEAGYHKGDIGNFTADAEGNGEINFSTNEWCIGCGDDKKDILGKAIIVHQGTDDFTTQPTGNAGARVSCGGIIE